MEASMNIWRAQTKKLRLIKRYEIGFNSGSPIF